MELDGWEHAIVQASRQAMGTALQALVTAHEGVERCPACGSSAVRWEDTRSRIVLTSFGRVVLAVRRARCRACGQRYQPARAALSSLGHGNTTAALRAAAVWAGSSWPFATAARLLRELLGATISPEQVRQVTLAGGTQVARAQQQAAAAVVTPSAAAVRTERAAASERTRHGTRPAPSSLPPARLLVGLDGGWLACRDQPNGMEGKVGVVATGVTAIGLDRQALVPRRYVATFDAAAVLGNLTYAAAETLGGTQRPTQIVGGDGAGWIKHQAAQHFPEATCILDWAHLARIILRAVRLACPGSHHRDQRRATYRTVTDRLWSGEVDAAVETLAALRDPAAPCAALAEALGYLASQRDWLGDYAAWQAAGYPIGSGMIERAVALVSNWRMKNRGMRWKRTSASAIVALRVEQLNQDWDAEMGDLAIAA
jgi:hypothetical protein